MRNPAFSSLRPEAAPFLADALVTAERLAREWSGEIQPPLARKNLAARYADVQIQISSWFCPLRGQNHLVIRKA